MHIFRCVCVVLFFITSISLTCAQDKSNFPTNEEITLMLTQAERAVQQYKPVIDEQGRLLGNRTQAAATKDREVVQALEMGIKAFRKNPQGFNGPLGFAFFEWIDDAGRNALLCATTATAAATNLLLEGNVSQAKDLMQHGQSCSDASALLYTVSENAGALYTRYVKGAEQLALEGASVAQKCAEVLKGAAAKKNH
jgi:hypothetical protein